MQGFRQFIESATEKYALKAVYTAGGPGSGKSFISSHMFEWLNFRHMDIDHITELFKSRNLPVRRERAWDLLIKRLGLWFRNFDPILIDGTGRNSQFIMNQSDSLRKIGYDTYMVFVKVSKETARQRNLSRSRVVPSNVFDSIYDEALKNLEIYKQYFQKDIVVIDNTIAINLSQQGNLLKQAAVNLISKPNQQSIRNHVLNYAQQTQRYPSDVLRSSS